MNRPGTLIYNKDLYEFKQELEESTGFVCYEVQPGDQTVFYGTSDKFNDFKTMIGQNFNTGTIAFLMDEGSKYMYSRYKDQWYEIG